MLRHALRILLLSFFMLPTAWSSGSVALVLSENSGPYRDFSTTFTEVLQGTSWRLLSAGPIDSLNSAPPPTLIVTAGIEAFRQVLNRGSNTPIVATLIGKQIYEKLLIEAGRNRPRTTAIFIEQPAARQVAFLKSLLPGRNRVGLVLSHEGKAALEPLRQALSAGGLQMETEDSDSDETLLPAINALMPRVHLMLATPDPKIYKRDNIKSILITSYRHQKPLIAFSSTFVNAGALAAIFSTPQQIARQTADLVASFENTLPGPEYPQQFSIAINRNVAEALNLQLAEDNEIRRTLTTGRDAR